MVSSGGASPLLIAGHRQVISRISKGNQNPWYIILLLPLLTARAKIFLPGHMPWHALVWRHYWWFLVASVSSRCLRGWRWQPLALRSLWTVRKIADYRSEAGIN